MPEDDGEEHGDEHKFLMMRYFTFTTKRWYRRRNGRTGSDQGRSFGRFSSDK